MGEPSNVEDWVTTIGQAIKRRYPDWESDWPSVETLTAREAMSWELGVADAATKQAWEYAQGYWEAIYTVSLIDPWPTEE